LGEPSGGGQKDDFKLGSCGYGIAPGARGTRAKIQESRTGLRTLKLKGNTGALKSSSGDSHPSNGKGTLAGEGRSKSIKKDGQEFDFQGEKGAVTQARPHEQGGVGGDGGRR